VDVEGLGEQIVNQLVNAGIVKHDRRIFTIRPGVSSGGTGGAGADGREVGGQNLLAAIDKSRRTPRWRASSSRLGIRNVGETTAQAIWRAISASIDVRFLAADDGGIAGEVPDVGPVVAALHSSISSG
jgi:DNA ligase (NAD+)